MSAVTNTNISIVNTSVSRDLQNLAQPTADVATQTASISELFYELMKENPDALKKELADRKSSAETMVDQLRGLCEELPEQTLDPVTYEVFDKPMLTHCGHTLDRDTVKNIYLSNRRVREDGDPIINCPTCREETSVYTTYFEQAFAETIEHLKKIQGVFRDVNGDETTIRVTEKEKQ